MTRCVPSQVSHERQRIDVPAERAARLRKWATEGTALAVGARVRDDAGRIALVQNDWTTDWFLPGGAVEANESSVEAARREVREETGLRASIGAVLVVVDQTYSPDDGGELFSGQYVVYAATANGPIADHGCSEGEIQGARWFETVPDALHDDELIRPYL